MNYHQPMSTVDARTMHAQHVDSFEAKVSRPTINLLPRPTDKQLITTFLGVSPRTMRKLGGGDNDVYLVDDQWIFRFPKHELAKRANIREQAFLKSLGEHIKTTTVPHYQFWDQSKGAGGYREIVGHNLSRALMRTLTIDEKNDLAQATAQALCELHRYPLEKITVDLVDAADDELESLAHLKQLMLTHRLFREGEYATINDAIARVETMLTSSERKNVMLHGDLHCDNVIYNQEKKCLAGIIDFSDAMRGIPPFDLVGFYRASPTLAEDVQRHYADLMGMDKDQLVADCRALALVKYSRDVLMNRQDHDEKARRRFARSGFVVMALLEE